MNCATGRFNLYLTLCLGALLLCGCKTSKSKQPEAVIRIHAHATEDTSFTRTVKVFKNESVSMKIHQMPLLSEMDLADAKVVEALGGFAISLKFKPTGQWRLDHYTSLNIGRNYAIFVIFGKDPAISRWIAAPIISSRISDGMIIFTPDCTREEAEEIVRGLAKAMGTGVKTPNKKTEEAK